ncbi:Os04g0595450, partial [Oryza sativa Japonica Group]
ASGLHCTWEEHWLTISPSGRLDVIICGRGGTRSRGPYQFNTKKFRILLNQF